MLALIATAVVERDATRANASLLLLMGLAGAGAAGGALHHATRGFRDAGWLEGVISWAMSSYLVVAIVSRVVLALVPGMHLGRVESQAIASTTGPMAKLSLGGATLLFSVVMTDLRHTHDRPRLFSWLEETIPRGVTATIVLAGLAALALVALPAADQVLPRAASRAEAQAMLGEVAAEARRRPDKAQVQLLHGSLLVSLERFDEAIPVLTRAAALAPGDAVSRGTLGWVLNRNERYREAVPYLREAVRLDPRYGSAFQHLGWALARLGRDEAAATAYREAVRLEPTSAGAAVEYSFVLSRLDRKDEALAQALRAVQLDPTYAWFHREAAMLLRTRARFADARIHFDHAVRLAPDDAALWVQKGINDYLLQDAPAAAAAFQTAARLDSTVFTGRPSAMAMWREARHGRTGDTDGGARVAPDSGSR